MKKDRPNTVVIHNAAALAPALRGLFANAVAMFEAEKSACQASLMEAEPIVREAAGRRHPDAPWRHLASPEALAFERSLQDFGGAS